MAPTPPPASPSAGESSSTGSISAQNHPGASRPASALARLGLNTAPPPSASAGSTSTSSASIPNIASVKPRSTPPPANTVKSTSPLPSQHASSSKIGPSSSAATAINKPDTHTQGKEKSAVPVEGYEVWEGRKVGEILSVTLSVSRPHDPSFRPDLLETLGFGSQSGESRFAELVVAVAGDYSCSTSLLNLHCRSRWSPLRRFFQILIIPFCHLPTAIRSGVHKLRSLLAQIAAT